ncbi:MULTISPECIES: ABC transporter ATP-binding protein [Bacillus]|uniref:ABC transporter ATP-binding protein n=1 Tax=Bacillus TaxID=1386 RepID=UPI000977FA7E|nr:MULTISPECIES: ABC transporter ATP-binding protein [Bacillus]MCU4998210.1 ABC transporter ATP-binding protein/permease [Bacillus cereus]KAB7650053.1 ABC transporter ATP-binding protein [Bacillus sp. B2-WWTP-C-10-Post-4]MCU5037409.1 ABC transporter ATP-binding protein/permease [Bacillus cereus]MEC1984412.1 ABC transporter ATP-binding protein [Bacillus cereus]MEC3336271.1 ABC transporter ATP-binding protein [Bacillus cereus]
MQVDQTDKSVSLQNIIFAFSYWPRIFLFLWRANYVYLIFILLISLCRGLIPAVLLLATQNIVNSVSETMGTVNFSSTAETVLLFIALTIFNEFLSILETHFTSIYKTNISNHINVEIFEKVGKLCLEDFENAEVQDQLQRSQQEANYRPFEIFQQILSIFTGCVTLFSSAAILINWNWSIALSLGLIPILFFFAYLHLGKKEFVIHYNRIPRYRKSWYLTYLLTRDSSFKEAKLYQLHGHFLNDYQNIINDFLNEDKSLAKKRTILSLFSQIISNVLIGGIIMYIAFAAFKGEINLGNLVAYISAVTLTYNNSQNIMFNIVNICKNNLYIEQLFSFLDYPVKEVDNKVIGNKVNNKILKKPIESIEFRNVSFKYPETDHYALKNVSFSLKKGETLALVGRNGSGKSTLVKLLTLLYTNFEGDILINGRNIKDIPPTKLYSEIGMVFQDFVQYEMSLRNNVGFGDIENLENDVKIKKSLFNAGLPNLTEKLPQKLETQLGKYFQEGNQLSGGQWQRVAISRAFMRDASLYILDEPSAALDPKAEADIFQRFYTLVANKIGIFISHRYTTLRYASKIIVLEEGEIVEEGNHYELMENEGLYSELYNLQMKHFQQEEVIDL